MSNGFAPEPETIGYGINIHNHQPTDEQGDAIGGPIVRAMREGYEKLPTLQTVVADVTEQEHKLARDYRDVLLGQIDMCPETGRIGPKGNKNGRIQVLKAALSSMLAYVNDGPNHAGAYVTSLEDTEWRAHEVNQILALAQDKQVKLHFWKRDGHVELYAVTGPNYVPYSPTTLLDTICESTTDALTQRCQALYNPLKMTVKMVSDALVKAEDLAKDEAFRSVLVMRSAEDGSRSIQRWIEVLRSLCTNLAMLRTDKGGKRTRKHTGSDDAIRADVQTFCGGNIDLNRYLDAYREGSQILIPREDQNTLLDTMCGVGSRKLSAPLRVNGVRSAALADMIQGAADKEDGLANWTALHNAVTRAAHESRLPNLSVQGELEQQGSDLLYWNRAEIDAAFARAKAARERMEKEREKEQEKIAKTRDVPTTPEQKEGEPIIDWIS